MLKCDFKKQRQKMKVVILAGGLGTRLAEETDLRPKPMVEIGQKPILWHIMKIYSYFGFNDFIILCGYKGFMIKEYFANYYLHTSDITFDLKQNTAHIHQSQSEPWSVTLVDTGLNTMTGARIAKARKYIGEETFMLTYGDGLSDINLNKLLNFHKSKRPILTISAVQPEGRFGVLDVNDDMVNNFVEKPSDNALWINGGFMVCEPEIFNYLSEDESLMLEQGPMQAIAKDGGMAAFKHYGFWKCMDTMRDKLALEKMYKSGEAKWVL